MALVGDRLMMSFDGGLTMAEAECVAVWPAVRDGADPAPFPRQFKRPDTPDPKVIDMAREVLKYAEEGVLQALAVAVVYSDGLVPGAEINSGWAAAPGTYFALNSAIAKLSRARDRYCDDKLMKDDDLPNLRG